MTKTDVINWIAACKAKALKSITHEVEEYLIQEADNIPELQEDFAIYDKLLSDSKYLGEKFSTYMVLCRRFSVYVENSNHIYLSDKAAMMYLFFKNREEYQEQRETIKSFSDKASKVSNEYNRLQAQVKNMRKIPKMVNYLNSLGFDTSTIKENPQVQVNKDLLFVCHDNKPDEDK